MEIRIIDESEITDRQDGAIKKLLCRCFPKDAAIFSQRRGWHGYLPAWSVLLKDGDDLVAHASVIERAVLVGDIVLQIAGVGNVCVTPERRGEHLARLVLEKTMTEARARGYDCGMLSCNAHLEPLYTRLGWHVPTDREVIRVEVGEEKPFREGHRLMVYPLVVTELPPGRIHLQGDSW